MELYENIRRLRIMEGLSQEELAKRTGYTSRSSIAKIEAGEVDLSQSKILEFAKVFRVTPTELMGLNDKPSSPYGDHQANLDYFADKPELLETYKEIHDNESLQLLFDSARDLEPQDLETVLMIINGIKKERGS